MRKWVAIVLAGALLGGVVGTAVALGSRATDPNLSSAGSIKQVKTTFGQVLVGTSTTTWVDVGRVKMTVPSGEKDLIDARFLGSATCYALTAGASGSCLLRIVATSSGKTLALQPSTMTDVLDVVSGAEDDDSTLGMEKSRVLPAGTWTIHVQHAVSTTDVYFGIYTYHLTVERAPV